MVEALQGRDPSEVMGIDKSGEAGPAEQVMRQRLNEKLMCGVTLVDPATTYLEPGIDWDRIRYSAQHAHPADDTHSRHGLIGPNTSDT